MWYFTKYGFYSVVCARQGTGDHRQPVDPHRVMVRARSRQHLLNLFERFDGLLGEADIHASAGTDYAYRMFVDKTDWAEVARELALECDYDNFKSAVARQGATDHRYTHALHEVWETMHGLQG